MNHEREESLTNLLFIIQPISDNYHLIDLFGAEYLIRSANVRIVGWFFWHLMKQISIDYREPHLLIGWGNRVSSIKAFSDHAFDHNSIEYQVPMKQSTSE